MKCPRLAALVLPIPLAIGACAPPADETISRAEIESLMKVQAEAWNKGDMAAFVSYYDPGMTFCNSRGVTWGLDNLQANYERSYPTAKERGRLSFDLIEVRPLGAKSAMVLGEYRLEREAPASGFFTLLIQRTKAGLRIAHDHTSESPKAASKAAK